MSDSMNNGLKITKSRPLTERESAWVAEILHTRAEWETADISKTVVVMQEECDEGLSILLKASEPENPKLGGTSGYIGRIWINTSDGCSVEIRLDHFHGSLRELFVLFVDPKDSSHRLPERWTEVSHEAFPL